MIARQGAELLVATVIASVSDRVANGMTWLDEHYGPEWIYRIDFRVFNVQNMGSCPLAQVEGRRYSEGMLERLDIASLNETRRLGFAADPVTRNYHGEMVDYANLTTEWKRQIEARLELAALRTEWRERLAALDTAWDWSIPHDVPVEAVPALSR